MRRALAVFGCTLLALVAYAATQSQFFSGDVVVKGVLRDFDGTNYVKDAPMVATNWVRSNGVWVPLPAGAGGISDAPSDTYLYGRYNATWLRLDDAGYAQHLSSPGVPWVSFEGAWSDGRDFFSQTGHVHSGADITTGTVIPARLGSGVLSPTNVLFADGIFGPMDWDWIDGKPTTFPPNSHSHAWADITGEPDLSTNGHQHAASDVTSGLFDTSRLGSGTANSSTFLRGDRVWATPPEAGEGTNGIPDAPNDGTFYGRKSGGWVQPAVADVDGLQADLDDRVLYTDLDDLTVGGLTITGATTLLGMGSDITSGSGYKFLVQDSAGNVMKKLSTAFALSYLGAAAATHGHDWGDITGEPTTLAGYGITDGALNTRSIATGGSLTGGGDLTANRTLLLDGDESTPSASKYYGTDSGGTRGFHALPSSGSGNNWTLPLLAWVVAQYDSGTGNWTIKSDSNVSSVVTVSSSPNFYTRIIFDAAVSTADYIIESSVARQGSDTGYFINVYLDRSSSTTSEARVVFAGTGNATDPNDDDVIAVKIWKATP